MHYLFTPVTMVGITKSAVWAFLLTFIQIFILWSLKFIASQLENPFVGQGECVNMSRFQREHNHRLLSLVAPSTQRTPKLKTKKETQDSDRSIGAQKSLADVTFDS